MRKSNSLIVLLQSVLVISSVYFLLFSNWKVGLMILFIDIIIGYQWHGYVQSKKGTK